ncbi:CRTAC1 family protein [Coleofasciculus sp. E2-BRE-01]|uniref:CRTAC1 family protein n=1 Tax=Coleofasciculus sp. E2-BRE-01 TaxID=3069524 RepID=UPI0032F5863F
MLNKLIFLLRKICQLTTVSRLTLVTCTLLIVITAHFIFLQPANEEINLSVKSKNWFTHSLVVKNAFKMVDLGVVDIESNNILDIFTSNHNHGQFISLGNDRGKFTDNMLSKFRLDQDPEFPGLEYSGTEPLMDTSGIYIYWQERSLVIKTHQTKNLDKIHGMIDFSAPVKIEKKHSFDLDVKEYKLASGAEATTIKFTTEGENSNFSFTPNNVSIPFSFQLDKQIPLEQVYIGNKRVNPSSHDFSFYLRDRHGMAWADYDQDGITDVFIVRGGLKGRIDKLPESYSDELLISQGDLNYEKKPIEELDITKNGCPGMQTAWVDFDSDNLLDLYIMCFELGGETHAHSNQLYRQGKNEKFINVATEVNLDMQEMGTFFWLDADRDRDIDFFWVDEEAFWLYVNEAGKFEPQLIGSNTGSVAKTFIDSNKLTIADYDADGDLDVFAASPQRNTLLINKEGKYEIIEPRQVGLPSEALTANWVDYDNDGLMDLHLVPDGLYNQQEDHKFKRTHALEIKFSQALIQARCTWLDVDNDGYRDLLMARDYHDSIFNRGLKKIFPSLIKTSFSFWNLDLYQNRSATNHWLQINLIGLPGNRQAIGAHIEVTTPDDRVQFQVVGQSEGSHYSQGHYRLYFGLGKHQNVDSVKVFWPDGDLQEFNNVFGDQLLTIKHENK